jgi:hypothetical protein
MYSALEMTCRAPRAGICGGGSTLSEYELYFNFARVLYPESVVLRPLLWANGPMPGLMFWPSREDELISDGYKSSWIGHKQSDGMLIRIQLFYNFITCFILLLFYSTNISR